MTTESVSIRNYESSHFSVRHFSVVYPSRVDWVGATTVIKSSLIVQI